MLLPPLKDLLERAGFTVRARNRATCAYCTGGDRMTVSFNEEVAHCFRCQWKTGRYLLARELGIISKDLTPAERLELAREQRQLKRTELLRKSFEKWKNRKERNLLDELYGLQFRARFARQVLAIYNQEELAWCALGQLYHRENSLMEELDYLKDQPLPVLVELWRVERMKAH